MVNKKWSFNISQKLSLDYLDIEILKILQKNARTPYSEIGRELGLSDAAVHYRIKKLIKKGVIRRFTIEINPQALGFFVRATFGIEVDPSLSEQVALSLAKKPNFYLVWAVSGAHNIHAKVVFKDHKELQKIIYYLHTIKGIKSYHFSILLKSIKEDFVYSDLLRYISRIL